MMLVRGNPLDYDNWVELGATRWSYPQVLPYFKRMECFAEGGDAYRGDSGELKVRKKSRIGYSSGIDWSELCFSVHDGDATVLGDRAMTGQPNRQKSPLR